jgi:hypothetical protein
VKTSNGSNMPFAVPSSTTYDDLRILVAEKLRRFPGLVQLRYRLESDRPKAGATSIQSEEEFGYFMEHMRMLIVPPRTQSGKKSARALKPIRVYFEDAADTDGGVGPNEASSNKKVSVLIPSIYLSRLIDLQNKKGTSHAAVTEVTPEPGSIQGLNAERDKAIARLQTRWKCELHSKDKPVYCWNPSGAICYVLSHSNLGYWACDIVCHKILYINGPGLLTYITTR